MKPHERINRNSVDTNAVDNSELPRHRWYPIKEGFSANLVATSIVETKINNTENLHAIEPFSGSGTTPVECALKGIKCSAYEINPFLAFAGRTKLQQVPAKSFKKYGDIVAKALERSAKSHLEDFSTFTERSGKSKWLFNINVLRSFTSGINSLDDQPAAYRDLLKLALIRAVMDNCNAYPDGKCLRYKRLPNYNCFNQSALIDSFNLYSGMIAEDLLVAPLKPEISTIECMDSRALTRSKGRRFDLCVTSPPYLNSFDYSDVYRPELYLAGYVKDNTELMKIRLNTVRSHLQANWKAPSRNTFGTIYAKIISELCENKARMWNKRIPEMVQAYFEDLEDLIKTLSSKANPNALLKIAVATSAYAGVVIPVDFILAEIAETNGWELQEIQVIRRLRSSAQHWKHENEDNQVPELRESIVVLRFPRINCFS